MGKPASRSRMEGGRKGGDHMRCSSWTGRKGSVDGAGSSAAVSSPHSPSCRSRPPSCLPRKDGREGLTGAFRGRGPERAEGRGRFGAAEARDGTGSEFVRAAIIRLRMRRERRKGKGEPQGTEARAVEGRPLTRLARGTFAPPCIAGFSIVCSKGESGNPAKRGQSRDLAREPLDGQAADVGVHHAVLNKVSITTKPNGSRTNQIEVECELRKLEHVGNGAEELK